ncbi:MAG: radical SAM protein, partial [Aquificaceae bacterium]
CNLRCPWCDQPKALPFKKPSMSLEELLSLVQTYPHKHIVITGGEPFTEKHLSDLVKELIKLDKRVQIETNGTLWQEGLEEIAQHIHITCCPKADASWYIDPKIRRYAQELKFVVDEKLKLDVLLSFTDFLKKGCVVLQPESNKPHFLNKALEIQLKLLNLGYQVRV